MAGLQMTKVNLQKAKNCTAHRTVYYTTTNSNDLVARRAQSVTITLTFNRPAEPADKLTITVGTGPSPSTANNSQAVMVVSGSGSNTVWSAVRGRNSGNSMPVTINIPVSAIIGGYKMTLQIGRQLPYHLGRLIVLFNAWAEVDQVYMADDAQRQEYVLNDTTSYWYGGVNNYDTRAWNLAQFDVLEPCLTLLERSSFHASNVAEDISSRSDALHVGRVMSAMVNSNDGDRGVIVGNWSGNYTGGTSPLNWDGSGPILHQWMKSGPVKYAQCWVYAGVLCTVLRCLGIPARMITNFESAHDTDANLVIDTYYNADGSRDNSRTSDSVWNFHAWDEMWSTRPDLGLFYNGWQMVDSTPQERSNGIFCFGPCSQKAVKQGEVKLPYDGEFAYSQVNADVKEFMITNQGMRLLQIRTGSIGQKISTKAMASFGREDITNDYKYPEGSAEEREVNRKALGLMGITQPSAFSMAVREIPAQLSGVFKNSKIELGEDLNVQLVLKSTADQDMPVNVKVNVTSVTYNDTTVNEVLAKTESFTLGVNEEKSVPINIPYSQYKDKMSPDCMFNFQAVCEDDIDGKLLVTTMVKLENPPLIIKNTKQAKMHKETSVDITFTNSLNQDVTGCVLNAEGSGLLEKPVTIQGPTIKPGQSHTFKVKINPTREGSRCLLATLTANEVPSAKAFQSIPVDAE